MPNESTLPRFPLDASVLQRLDSLALLTRRPMATGRPGRRRSPLVGSSMEFADYRRYTPGDDFRRIDRRAAYRRVGSGKNAVWTVGEFLNRLPRSGTTDLNKALYDLGRIVTSPGL